MKKLILFSMLFSLSELGSAQTFISPTIGIDFTRMEDIDSTTARDLNLSLLEKGFTNESPVFGIKLKQILPYNLFLLIASNFTYKNVKATNFIGFVSPTAISYNYFRNNISLNYIINKYYIGIGGNLNILSKISYVYHNDVKSEFINKLTERGIQVSLGRNINKFDLELYYYYGLSSIHDQRYFLHTKPLASLGLTINYNLKLIDKLEFVKKTECPKF
jgi:hypothetical protein